MGSDRPSPPILQVKPSELEQAIDAELAKPRAVIPRLCAQPTAPARRKSKAEQDLERAASLWLAKHDPRHKREKRKRRRAKRQAARQAKDNPKLVARYRAAMLRHR